MKLQFSAPVEYIYNPLDYARAAHEKYLELYARKPCRVILLGMNPGPFGMAQTGIPFGEIAAVRDFIGIESVIKKPNREHPARPIQGFQCTRSEVSGRRLWGLFQQRFENAQQFFKNHFVANYCPLVFMNARGANITPDKLLKIESEALFQLCDTFLVDLVDQLKPEYVIGIGRFAEKRARLALKDADRKIKIDTVLHPSPASPAANRGWAQQATRQLKAIGVW